MSKICKNPGTNSQEKGGGIHSLKNTRMNGWGGENGIFGIFEIRGYDPILNVCLRSGDEPIRKKN